MDIIIIANFCETLDKSGNSRFLELATMLSAEHQVEVITSDFHHMSKQHIVGTLGNFPFPITLQHECGYPKNICIKRFFSHYEFGKNVGAYLKKRKKPDVIYAAVPSLTAAMEAAKYCKKNGVRFVIDVQDLWPEAFEMVFRVPLLSQLAFAPFRFWANQIYAAADGICAVSETYANRALSVNYKCRQGTVAYLGTNLKKFDEIAHGTQGDQKSEGVVRMAYIGTLGHSYNLTGIFDAMEFLRKQGRCKQLAFMVMGDGPLREQFEVDSRSRSLPVIFTGMLPYIQMVSQLQGCDFAVNPIMHGAAQSIINKVGDYAAAGLAVINTQECQEYRNLVTRYEMGINCDNGNVQQLAEAIARLTENKELREKMGLGNRRLAEERFDRSTTYRQLIDEATK